MLDKKKIFIIGPVRAAEDDERKFLENYVSELESRGHEVYLPQRDTNQDDPSGGLRICSDNRKAIRECDEVHVYWNGNSEGSIFDFGMAFMADKPVVLINNVERLPHKDFRNVALDLNSQYKAGQKS